MASSAWRDAGQRFGLQPELVADPALAAGELVVEEGPHGR